MTAPADVTVVTAGDWRRWRALRLRALQDSPDAFGSTYARELGFTEADWADRLSSPDGVCVLASVDGTDVGMGGGYVDLPGWLHVVAMWVGPDRRGRRVGHAVLDGIRAWADERALRLHLDVAQGNDAARRSYLGYGFTGTGETRPLRDGCPDLVERLVLPTRVSAGRSSSSTPATPTSPGSASPARRP